MNDKKVCDGAMIEAYIRGELDEARCRAVESHALQCEDCRARLDAALEPTAEFLRQANTHVAVPAAVSGRIDALRGKRSTARLKWGFASSFALILAGLWAFRASSTIVLAEVEGIVLANGQPAKPGDAFLNSVQVTTIGPGKVSFGGETLTFRGPWNELQVGQAWGRAEVGQFAAPIYPEHGGSAKRAVYAYGTDRIETLGTRFSIEPTPSGQAAVSVMEHRVVLKGDQPDLVLSEGQSNRAGSGFAQDDPTRFDSEELSKVPGLGARPNRVISLPALSDESVDGLKTASKMSNSAQKYWRIAKILTDAEEHDAAGWAILKAFQFDPDARLLSTSEIRSLLVRQLAFGHAQVERQVLDALCSRSEDGFGADWQAMVRAKESNQRGTPACQEASWRIYSSLKATDLVPAASLAFDHVRADPAHRVRLRAISYDLRTHLAKLAPSEIRSRARLLAVLAETLYYDPVHVVDSLEPLRASKDLWPTPARVAHFCARLAETGRADESTFEELKSSFFADPTYLAAERVLTFLRDTGEGPRGRNRIHDFARWVGDTFDTLVPAQMAAASALMESSTSEAWKYAQRGLQIAENDPSRLEKHHASLCARLKWFESPSKSNQTRRSIADQFGLLPGGFAAEFGSQYFEDTGDPKAALSIIGPEANRFVLARLLRKSGRTAESARAYETIIANASPQSEPLDVAESQIALAELELGSNPDKAKASARRFLSTDLSRVNEGWRRYRHYEMLYRSRALAVLGRYPKAASTMSSFLEKCAFLIDRTSYERTLSDWRSKSSSISPPRRE